MLMKAGLLQWMSCVIERFSAHCVWEVIVYLFFSGHFIISFGKTGLLRSLVSKYKSAVLETCFELYM